MNLIFGQLIILWEDPMPDIRKIYGIDLGTTYSCIAHINKNGLPEIIPNSEGDQTTPSVVFFENEGNIVVGKTAKLSKELEPNRVVDFVKRNMADESFAFNVDGKEYKPEQISAIILKKLVNDASAYLGEVITDVVITCPAYFGIAEREATKNAGIIAGLNVHSVLNEPTAAAYSYGLDRTDRNKVILVYDLGGGTFDVTVIEVKDKNISVITTGGHHQLGGKDWDDRIIEFFATEFMRENGEDNDPRDDIYSVQDLRNKAEEAKRILSAREKYKTVMSYSQKRTEIELTREKFEDLTKALMDRTIEFTKNIMKEARDKGYSQIDEIILVGGSTKMPMVHSRIVSDLGMEPLVYEPDLAIAKGAALISLKKLAEEIIKDTGEDTREVEDAANLVGIFLPGEKIVEIAQGTISNVNSKAFGVVVTQLDKNGKEHEFVRHMIDRHSRLPAEKIGTDFGTLYNNQTSVLIKLMEQADGNFNPSKEITDNILITEGELKIPGNLPAGSPLHITFRLEEDGRLTVSALEPSSSKKIKLEATVTGVMNAREVEESKKALTGMNIS